MRSAPTHIYYLGTSKAGSTWVFELLRQHPQVGRAARKDVFFFDRHRTRGLAWYMGNWHSNAAVRVDISHDYLYSLSALRSIQMATPSSHCVVILREPVERTISAARFLVRNGLAADIAGALASFPHVVAESMYSTPIACVRRMWRSDRRHIYLFDDLREAPSEFAGRLLDDLGLTRDARSLEGAAEVRLRSAEPRSRSAARIVKRVAELTRNAGQGRAVDALKGQAWLRSTLYRELRPDDNDSEDLTDIRLRLSALFRSDVLALDAECLPGVARRWGYA